MRLAVLARCELDLGGRAAVAVDLADRSLADGRLIREHLAVSAIPNLALGTLIWAGELQRSEHYHDGAIAAGERGAPDPGARDVAHRPSGEPGS